MLQNNDTNNDNTIEILNRRCLLNIQLNSSQHRAVDVQLKLLYTRISRSHLFTNRATEQQDDIALVRKCLLTEEFCGEYNDGERRIVF